LKSNENRATSDADAKSKLQITKFKINLSMCNKLPRRFDFIMKNSETFWFATFYLEILFAVGGEVKEFFRNRSRTGFCLRYNPTRV
jgi:hypothetical protein